MMRKRKFFQALTVLSLSLLTAGMAVLYANAGENRVSQMEFKTINKKYIKLKPTNYCTPILENSKGKLHMQELDNAWKTYPNNPELQKWWEKDALCVVTDNSNGRFDNTDEFTVNYPGIGDLEGREVGCRITFSYIAATASTNAGWNTEKSHVILVRSENGQAPLGTACLYNGFVIRNMESCNVEYDFYFTDTGDSISMKGSYMTFGSLNGPGGGIDAKEGVAYKAANGWDVDFYVREDTNLAYEGHTIDGTEQALVYGASNDFTDRLGSNSFTKNSVTFELDTDKPKVSIYSKLNDCWFSYASYPLFATAPGGPQKVGIAGDGSEAGSFDKVNSGDVLSFEVRQQVQALNGDGGSRYQSFSLTDTLPKELDYQEAYVLNKDTGERLDSTKVTISTADNNKKVIATFNPDYLQAENGGMPYQGETYALVVKAVVNGSAYNAGEDPFVNQGFSNINGTEMDAGDVPMTAAIPKLAIDKSVSKREWQVGDSVDYTVTVSQTGENATAKNVAISDLSIPQGLALSDCQATGVQGVTVTRKNNTWTAVVPSMAQGETVTITFHCTAKEAANGKVTTNTAKAKADNAPEVQDSAEVYINTANLAITKTADAYEKKQGEAVNYTVKVRNTKTGTVARNVVISDLSLPAGLELTGTPALSGVPNGEKGTAERSGTGWVARITNLPAGQEVAVTFSCTATGAINGKETVNTAKAKADNASEVQDVEEVYVNSAALSIEKETPKYEWQVGDKVDYTIKVTNTKQGTVADKVAISDMTLPEGLKLDGTPVLSGVPGTVTRPVKNDKYVHGETAQEKVTSSIKKENNGFTAAISALPGGATAKVTFHCVAGEAANGLEAVNTATASAANADAVQDVEEVYVNSAELAVGKEVSKYEWQVGQEVDYTVKVTNTKQGTFADNVVISDVTLPEGLRLDGAPELTGVPGTVNRPVRNDKHTHGETAEEKVTTDVKQEKNSFIASISTLPAGVTAELTFHCTVEDAINGTEVTNTAHAKADNAGEAQDSAKIWVNTPGLQIKKEADGQAVKVGDIVTYELKVINTNAGTLARNIVIADKLDGASGPFAKLQKNSIALMDSEGNKIEDAKATVSGDGFRIETGRSLACPGHNYGVWDMENVKGMQDGGKLNPEGVEKETLLTVEYQVKITGKAAGESIKNIATASSDEIPGVEDEEGIVVNGPHLDVEKSSDKHAYAPNDTAEYKVTVRQTREGHTAKDVTVTDSFDREGAEIEEGSIQVKLNGKKATPVSARLNDAKNGYTVETGISLGDTDKLDITYKVKFAEKMLMEEKDAQFVNVATAKGSNTNESMDENTVVASYKEAVLQVRKSSEKDEYISGETGEYKIEVKQLAEGASAKQVVLTDSFDQEGMCIQEGSIQVRLNGKKVTPASATLNAKKNGYTVETGLDLSYGDSLTVTYRVEFPEGGFQSEEGEEAVNKVSAKGTNTNESTDENEVRVVYYKPELKTAKVSDRKEYAAGEAGSYEIRVSQTKKNAVARQVVLADAFDREGMEIQEGSISVTLNGKEAEPKSVALNAKKNGYTIETGMDLSYGDELTVAYKVEFPESSFQSEEGEEVVNKVTAKGENTDESTDESRVHVVYYRPELKTVKASSKKEYAAGEAGSYEIRVSQTKKNAVARQVVLADAFDREGMEIQEGSISVTLNGKEAEPKSVAEL